MLGTVVSNTEDATLIVNSTSSTSIQYSRVSAHARSYNYGLKAGGPNVKFFAPLNATVKLFITAKSLAYR
jgi:hypothetical protein